jgi:hypothetical protein
VLSLPPSLPPSPNWRAGRSALAQALGSYHYSAEGDGDQGGGNEVLLELRLHGPAAAAAYLSSPIDGHQRGAAPAKIRGGAAEAGHHCHLRQIAAACARNRTLRRGQERLCRRRQLLAWAQVVRAC